MAPRSLNWPRRSFCVLALVLAVFGVWQCVVAAGGDAPDFRILEAGAAAHRAGEDPYQASIIERYGGGKLSYVYPPLALHGLTHLADLGFPAAAFVYALCLLAGCGLLGWVFLPRRGLWYLGLAAFAATGFAVARWNFQTGNLGLVELFLFAVACIALQRRRLLVFAATIGVLAFVKLLPICFLILLLPLVRRREAPAHALLWPLAVCAALHAASYALDPELTAGWWTMLTGSADGQHTPLHERTSGNNTPTFVLMLADLVALEPGFGLGDVTMLVLLSVASWVAWRAIRCSWRAHTVLAALPLPTIALLLAWPRLKPYGYGYAFVAVVIGAARIGPRRALWLLAGLGGLPAVMPWLPNLPIEALQLMKRNHLAVMLLAAGVVFALPDPRQSPH